MKKIIILLCILMPLCLQAQEDEVVKKHHFGVGIGLAVPGEIIFEVPAQENNTVSFYGEYRYALTPSFYVGAIYSMVAPHTGEMNLESSFENSEGRLETKTINITTKSNYHTLNAFVEYKTVTYGNMRFYVGLGGGPQLRFASFSHQSGGKNSDYFFSADLYAYAGLELMDHLRITVGHFHDLHYPITAFPSGAPYSHISVGWAF